MDEPKRTTRAMWLDAINPFYLILVVFYYALGAGIAHFLGHVIQWDEFLVGLACVLMLQMASYFLKEYFEVKGASNISAADHKQTNLLSRLFILVGLTALSLSAVLMVFLLASKNDKTLEFFILGIMFVLAFAYGVPPFSLYKRGFGELSNAIILSSLTPALAYLLQTGTLHRMLTVLTLPCVLVLIARELGVALQTYGDEMKYGVRTAMGHLGWQRGMGLHNLLILLAFVVLAGAALLGLPWGLMWPSLLSLPIGIFQIWQMLQISAGEKPRWRLLRFTADAIPLLMAYMLVLSLWTH
jgi:1,4-dihydroxy-2-naphthoate octaprenyltransferase